MEASISEDEYTHLCFVCTKKYRSWQTLYKHNRRYHPGNVIKKSYPCAVCERSFSKQERLIGHQKSAHKIVNWKCKACDLSFFDAKALDSHKGLLHKKPNPQCLKCNKTFTNSGGLREHNYYFHNEASKSKMYFCTKCDKSYRRRGSLSNHVTSVHSTKIFQCAQCNKVYSTKGHLKRHSQLSHNSQVQEKKPKCYFCVPGGRQTFSDNCEVFNHMRGVHLYEYPFKCRKNSWCVRQFSNTRGKQELTDNAF